MIDAGSVFNPSDFESIRLLVKFTNLTTQTEVRDSSKNSIIEIGEKKLVLEIPDKSCSANHNVLLSIFREDKKSDKIVNILNVTGKVLELENNGDGTMRISVDCIQFDEKNWVNLTQLFAARQQEILKFFSSVRGY